MGGGAHRHQPRLAVEERGLAEAGGRLQRREHRARALAHQLEPAVGEQVERAVGGALREHDLAGAEAPRLRGGQQPVPLPVAAGREEPLRPGGLIRDVRIDEERRGVQGGRP